ncbi:Keratin, type I cytoskeletal 18 [Plecturocebus cupreus]
MAVCLAGMGSIQNKETIQSLNDHLASYLNRIDNVHLAADDFIVKYETEMTMSQSMENDIHGLPRVIYDTNVIQLQLETEIETVKEELIFMKKNHKEELKGLQAQIASSVLTMEVYAPKSQDLTKIMAVI